MRKTQMSRVSLIILAPLCSPNAKAQQNLGAETPQQMLSAQIRSQGFVCEKTLSARPDKKRSRPDYEVWILRCSNATYRVGRAPDLPAKIEVLSE